MSRLETSGRLTPIVEVIRDLFGAQVLHVGVHGSATRSDEARPVDTDVLIVLTQIETNTVMRLSEAKRRLLPSKISILPFTADEIRFFPPDNRLQFIYGHVSLFGSLSIEAPTKADLVRYLQHRLFDRVLIRTRNFWLGQNEYYATDLRVLIRRIAKEIFWWWRVFLFLKREHFVESYSEACAALLTLVPEAESSRTIIDHLDQGRIALEPTGDLFELLHISGVEMFAAYQTVTST